MILIYYTILCINLLLIVFNKRSKVLKYLTWMLIVIIMIGNTANADLNAYRMEYSHSFDGNFELKDVGYSILQNICASFFQLNYWGFKAICVAIGLMLIEKTIQYFNGNSNYVWMLYLGYLVFIDTIQSRNFIAMAILVYSMIFYVKGGKRNTIIFAILVGLAATFHVSFIFYILFLIFKLKNKKIVRNSCIILSVCLFTISYFARNSFWNVIAGVILGDRAINYFSTFTRYSWIGCLILFVISLLPLLLYVKDDCKVVNENNQKFLYTIRDLNYCLMIALPLLLLNASFYRLYRNILLLNYIAYSLLIVNLNYKSARHMFLILYTIVTVASWNYCDFNLLNSKKDTIDPILEHNMFYGIDKSSDIRIYFYDGD